MSRRRFIEAVRNSFLIGATPSFIVTKGLEYASSHSILYTEENLRKINDKLAEAVDEIGNDKEECTRLVAYLEEREEGYGFFQTVKFYFEWTATFFSFVLSTIIPSILIWSSEDSGKKNDGFMRVMY